MRRLDMTTTDSHSAAGPDQARESNLLVLVGSFELMSRGSVVSVPHSVERVLACLALTDGSVQRSKLAGLLWSDVPERRAASNLRTALWRVQRARPGLVKLKDNRLRLAADVAVDLVELTVLARQFVDRSDDAVLERLHMLLPRVELLPDWDDEWVVADRERLRLLRLEALECASRALIPRRRLSEALLTAQAAVDTEPLRESTRRLVMEVQLARGNVGEAISCYRDYRDQLRTEFGVAPSPAMQCLVRSLGR